MSTRQALPDELRGVALLGMQLAAGTWVLATLVLLALALGVVADPGSAQQAVSSPSYDQAMVAGSIGATIGARIEAYPDAALTLAVLNWPLILASVSAGLLAGRHRLLARPADWTGGPTARKVSRLALAVGVPCGIVAGVLQTSVVGSGVAGEITGVALAFASAPLLSAGYVVWLARASVAGRLAWAARAGRQSLSVYIGESFVLAAVACPWGLGVYGELGPAAALAIAVATYMLFEGLASLWAHRFRQGPLEWVLRWWTYAARPPMRRSPPVATSRVR